jgi:hypothetical protein
MHPRAGLGRGVQSADAARGLHERRVAGLVQGEIDALTLEEAPHAHAQGRPSRAEDVPGNAEPRREQVGIAVEQAAAGCGRPSREARLTAGRRARRQHQSVAPVSVQVRIVGLGHEGGDVVVGLVRLVEA